MPLLQGQFDPTLLNSTVLQAELREIAKDLIEQTGELRFLDLSQRLLDRLAAKRIIW